MELTSPSGIAALNALLEAIPVVAAPTEAAKFNTIKVPLVPVACWRVEDLNFEFASSIPNISIGQGLKHLAQVMDQAAKKDRPEVKEPNPITIFGHADPVGEDEPNKGLAGRRAQAVYGLLTRDVERWEDLYQHKHPYDNWDTRSLQVMLDTVTGTPGKSTDEYKSNAAKRKQLFADYMKRICPAELVPIDKKKGFLAQGADAGGKGDYQGCGEFNPTMVFSQAEEQKYANATDKTERNNENKVNRRVMVLVFRKGSKVDPANWPCPKAKDSSAGCRRRLWSDGETRRSRKLPSERRLYERKAETFACRFYERITDRSPCDRRLPPVLKPVIKLLKIETEVPAKPPLVPVWFDMDDFSPRVKERSKFIVQVSGLPAEFSGKLRIDVGRLTNRTDQAATADTNESFTLAARLEVDVKGGKDPAQVDVIWDGMATVAVAQEFSNRQTPNTNTGNNVALPLPAIANGKPIPHGLYVVDQITLLQGTTVLGKERPADVDLSVPMLANLSFNANWVGDLAAYGLSPFRSDIETALQRFGGRDYMIRDANVLNRMNVRFIADPAVGNTDSVVVSIGGANAAFGSTPDGPAPLDDNLYTFHEGIGANITVFPSTFMTFNTAAGAIGPNDQATFRSIFSPLGVAAGATVAAPGTATARSVSGGAVTGGCNAIDRSNVTVTLDDDGLATVVTQNPALVPPTRASAIQAALRAFVRMLGNTINHEIAHALGVVSRVRANNQITISGTTVTSPLNGDGGAHNRVTNNTNIVDAGGTRSFVRRIEATGIQQRFNATNAQYLRDCIPFDRKDN